MSTLRLSATLRLVTIINEVGPIYASSFELIAIQDCVLSLLTHSYSVVEFDIVYGSDPFIC